MSNSAAVLSVRDDRNFQRSMRAPRLLAIVVLVLFFGFGGLWSGFAEISAAAIAPGLIGPQPGSRIAVQHLEGGIVAERHVADGDRVSAGDALVTLDDLRARAGRDEALFERSALLAEEAMLSAEAAGAEGFEPPDELSARSDEPEIASIIRSTEALFLDRRTRRASRADLRTNQIAQLSEQIHGYDDVETALSGQLALLDEEIEGLQSLVERGLTPRMRLLALQRERERISGEQARTRAMRALRAESIEQVRLEALEERDSEAEERAARLVELRTRLNAIRSTLASRQDTLTRTVVTAPVSGVVVEMAAPAPGAVIAPGARIMDIVPVNERMVVEARLSPSDIDVIAAGQEARVRLSAYRQRNLAPIRGEVLSVSADRIVDERTGANYFSAEIAIDEAALADAQAHSRENIILATGMPVEVMIVTGQRTMLEYLLDPFFASLRRGLRES